MNEYLSQVDIKQKLIVNKEILKELVPTVIKIGGSIAAESATTFGDIVFLRKAIGVPLAIVHGGGPEIDRALQEASIATRRVDGLRITDRETLSVVVSVLNGINTQMVEALQNLGVNAVGYSVDSGLLQAVIEDPRLGFVGSVSSVDAEHLKSHIDQGVVPIIAPVAIMHDNPTQYLNINGDTAAGAIATSLGLHLVLATDVPGVKDVNDVVLPLINSSQYEQMCAAGIITSGMLPKLQAGLQVANAGGKAIICQGKNLLYAFSGEPRGTLVNQ